VHRQVPQPSRPAPAAATTTTRRSALLASAAATLAVLPLAPPAAAGPLEKLSLGTARWSDAAATRRPPSSIPLNARIVPPSFATYLARFLLRYDDAASAWWVAQRDALALLPPYDAQRREAASFGSYASSMQRGLYAYVAGDGEANIGSYAAVRRQYGSLLRSLLDKYGQKRGAVRDIALLFAILPGAYQPTDALLGIDEEALAATGTKGLKFPANFQEDFRLLLPNKYQAAYDKPSQSFLITPRINLFEIPLNDGDRISTTFGLLSSTPLSRERAFTLDVYALLGLSGGAGCALTHTLVIPLDVVKTRLQTDPGRYDGILSGAADIVREEGPAALLLGAQATLAGYTWYGISVYPCYAFFKRFLAESLSPAFAVANAGGLSLVAGALASVVASLGLTPLEACRIRAVAQPERYQALGLAGTFGVIAGEDPGRGWKTLYAGLPSLMTRQVIFGSVKFLAFEQASESIFGVWPELRGTTATALGVSLAAGAISGALSSVVSQPADSVLTYVSKQSADGGGGLLDGARTMVREEGAASLFRGLGSRSIWAGCIIGGQFLLYDVFRSFFGISGEDLNQVLEVVLPKNM